MRVLIVKLASMGDLIHLLPSLTDAKRCLSSVSFDWAIDTHFAQIATWHTAVDSIITTNHRSWRCHLLQKRTYLEVQNVVHALKNVPYDLVIDAQGNIKTALLSALCQGTKVGWSGSCVPEWGAHFLYNQKVSVPPAMHAITKMRLLFAEALGYSMPSLEPTYDIQVERFTVPSLPLPSEYFVFVPNASHPSKLWPTAHWKALLQKTISLQCPIFLPWGSEAERKRAEELALFHSHVFVLPKLSLNEIGHLLLHARAVISMDTGLSHIASALGTPALTLYGPTDPALTGTVGLRQMHLCSPSSKLDSLSVEQVAVAFLQLLSL